MPVADVGPVFRAHVRHTGRFCHSDYHGNQGPRCEPAERSWAFRTSYTVIAPILADATLDAWFEGRTLETGKFGG